MIIVAQIEGKAELEKSETSFEGHLLSQSCEYHDILDKHVTQCQRHALH